MPEKTQLLKSSVLIQPFLQYILNLTLKIADVLLEIGYSRRQKAETINGLIDSNYLIQNMPSINGNYHWLSCLYDRVTDAASYRIFILVIPN